MSELTQPRPGASVPSSASSAAEGGGWTLRLRQVVDRRLPMDSLLPHRQPYFVGSWVYVFGVVTIAATFWVVASGIVLTFMGPQWWHESNLGHFFNSLHFWSVQLFFLFMVLHLWGQYFMASWRHGRAGTWMVGVVIFGISILTAFTGYLSQLNFASQFIAVNAKDAMNSAGIGAFFNVLNFGQMYGLHVMLLPVGFIFLIGAHIVMVRMRGVVKPIDAEGGSAS
jgi:quinol-cytochrome oxidoreductase complex cytochrome b subunit